MKKLLNILNILIISGTIIPTIVITSDYHKKQVTLKNNKEINYLQANNLEILQRNKRELKYNYYYINTNNYEQQHLNNTDNLEGDIITMKINENGDDLVGTTNGLYFKKMIQIQNIEK